MAMPAKQSPLQKAMIEAKKELTLSNVMNRLSKKTAQADNYVLKGFNIYFNQHIRVKNANANDIRGMILHHKQGYNVFKAFAKLYWDKDRKTAVEGTTWNLYTNVVENNGKASYFFVFQLLNKIAGLPAETFNSVVNEVLRLKPKTKTAAPKAIAAKKITKKAVATA